VQVGRFSEKHAKEAATEFKGLKWVPILHPAYLLRLDISQKGLAIQRTRIAIRDAVDALFAA
jgi:uracil-DNA glycosylase